MVFFEEEGGSLSAGGGGGGSKPEGGGGGGERGPAWEQSARFSSVKGCTVGVVVSEDMRSFLNSPVNAELFWPITVIIVIT